MSSSCGLTEIVLESKLQMMYMPFLAMPKRNARARLKT